MDSLGKELEDRQGSRIAVAAVTAILFLIIGMILSSAILSAPAEEQEKRAYLQIDEVFFLLAGSSSDMVAIEVTAFITNRGTVDAENVEIVAFVIEKRSNLALDKTTHSVGSIPKDKTGMADFSLNMPDDDSYTIKLILMENGKMSIKGSGTVNLEYSGGGSGTRFAPDYDTWGDKDGFSVYGLHSPGEGNFSIIVPILLGMTVIFIILIAVRRKNKRRQFPSKDLQFEENSESSYLDQNENVEDVYAISLNAQEDPKTDEFQLNATKENEDYEPDVGSP